MADEPDPQLRLHAFLPYLLSVASNAASDAVATAYRTLFGLRIPEWRLVTVLAESGAMSQQALCGRTRMDKVTVSRAAIALADRGLVRRTGNPADQRSHLLVLSDAGHALYDQVVPAAVALERRIFAGFDAAEQAQLRAMLVRIEAAVAALGDDDAQGIGPKT
jgi:DNA-binding MarR family transcriptional regulator